MDIVDQCLLHDVPITSLTLLIATYEFQGYTLSFCVNLCISDVFLSIKVQYWLFTVGYSLIFGTIVAKMWRVYHIFHNPAPNKRVIAKLKYTV